MTHLYKFFLLILLCTLSSITISCDFIYKKVPNENELLEKRLQEINWNEVSEYPSVLPCDSLMDKHQKKDCFFNFVTKTVQEKLSVDTLSILYPEIDTINVVITVNPDATVEFDPKFDDNQYYDRTKIDSIIKVRLADFPKIEPALKEGIPIRSKFILPIILKIE